MDASWDTFNQPYKTCEFGSLECTLLHFKRIKHLSSLFCHCINCDCSLSVSCFLPFLSIHVIFIVFHCTGKSWNGWLHYTSIVLSPFNSMYLSLCIERKTKHKKHQSMIKIESFELKMALKVLSMYLFFTFYLNEFWKFLSFIILFFSLQLHL